MESQYNALPNLHIIKEKISYFNPFDYLKVINFFKGSKIDAVTDFTGNFAGLILFCAKRAGVQKRISFYRGATDHFKEDLFRNLYNNFVKKVTLKYATNILSNSIAAFNNYFQNWEKSEKFKVIYNGVNASKFELSDEDNLRQDFKIPSSAFIVGHVGRYNIAKNHNTIMDVARELIKRHNDIYFILCGNGVRENLTQFVKDYNLQNQIFLFENRTDIPRFINTMDCFFFPSITEGQPNALVEAMIMGKPFVASNIESIKEMVAPTNYKYLFPPQDRNAFIIELEKLFLKRPTKDVNLKQFAINKFNHEILFQEFFIIIDK
ncbi:glycosyltransferase [Niabella ginsengisoli]|uniref:Glycosyltransferase n=1 Tax=Niabella ginsengisoli TaxID=522298 RepID=A0ABS9SKB4_9BACT|nr:glycosyltransferase [Niabella ginsengisoli]MCH5598731.1 glycosyltransferase [Niabella ginsengisoli]